MVQLATSRGKDSELWLKARQQQRFKCVTGITLQFQEKKVFERKSLKERH